MPRNLSNKLINFKIKFISCFFSCNKFGQEMALLAVLNVHIASRLWKIPTTWKGTYWHILVTNPLFAIFAIKPFHEKTILPFIDVLIQAKNHLLAIYAIIVPRNHLIWKLIYVPNILIKGCFAIWWKSMLQRFGIHFESNPRLNCMESTS